MQIHDAGFVFSDAVLVVPPHRAHGPSLVGPSQGAILPADIYGEGWESPLFLQSRGHGSVQLGTIKCTLWVVFSRRVFGHRSVSKHVFRWGL